MISVMRIVRPVCGKRWIRTLALLSLAAVVPTGCTKDSATQPSSDVIQLSGTIAEDMHLSAENEYLLTGQTFVDEGVTLTIEPGTVIKGLPYDQVGRASVLVVKPGAQIIADGTRDKPITFTTAFSEDVLPQRGLWGGLVLLGKAPVNRSGELFVEGIAGVSYGGDDPTDSSGILRYVRVWYGGREIGEGNEINGMTFAGVGSGTVVEHCEVAWNQDDGFEFFGGTVNVKYLCAAYCGDDCFDSDLGYQGKGQFLFAVLGRDFCGRGFEMDNDGSNMDAQPRSYPQFCNVTLLGPDGGTPDGDGADEMIRLREGTGGDFRNVLILNGNGVGLRVKDQASLDLIVAEAPASGPNAIYFSPSGIIHDCKASALHDDVVSLLSVREIDPGLGTIDMTLGSESIDPLPAMGGEALKAENADQLPNDPFFDASATYVGSFGDDLWLEGWSWLDEHGQLP